MRKFVFAALTFAIAAQSGFAGTSPCKDNAGTTEFKSSDSVWWGNVERAHTPYLEFAKTDLGGPAPEPDEVYTIGFDMKKAELSASAVATLNEVFAYLDTNASMRAQVEYPSGGRRNAEAVESWLVSQGIDGGRIDLTSGDVAGRGAIVRIRLVE